MNWTLLGQRLRAKRLQSNMTQEQLACFSETSNIYVCRIENGDARPTISKLKQLCDVLGCPLSYMIDGNNNTKYDKNIEQISRMLDGCSPYMIKIVKSFIQSIKDDDELNRM